MFTGSVKISELTPLSIVSDLDFFPLVQSSSMTTYQADILTLNGWFRVSGSAVSASWASASLSSSNARTSSYAFTASSALNSVTASYAISASIAFNSVSASFALSASNAKTASFALSASNSTTASFAFNCDTASFVNLQLQQTVLSASWASQSLSASWAPSNAFDSLPIGSFVLFGGDTAPTNWLECNGAVLLTSSYLSLSLAIQNTDPASTYGYLCDSLGTRNPSGSYFKMPDFRGEFLRGWDHGRGIDIGRANRSAQTSSIGRHFHGTGQFTILTNDDWLAIRRAWYDGHDYVVKEMAGQLNSDIEVIIGSSTYGAGATGTTNNIAVTADAFPRSVAGMWCIKYSTAFSFADSSAVLGGDVTGITSATVVSRIQNTSVSSTPPTDGQVLTYDSGSTEWVPQTVSSPGVAKAWIVFNGALVNGTLTGVYGSYNVTSISRIAIGRYTVVFTTPLNDTNYAIVGSGNKQTPTGGNISVSEYWSGTSAPYLKTTASVAICTLNTEVVNQSFADPRTVSVLFFGN